MPGGRRGRFAFQLNVGDDSTVEDGQEGLEDVSRIGLPLHPFSLPLLPGGPAAARQVRLLLHIGSGSRG
jgi:hypothetical protein